LVASSLLDWTIYQDTFASPEMRAVFDERAAVRRWVDVERAASRAQARLGIVPAEAGPIIAANLDAAAVDLEQLREDTAEVGRPIVGLARQLAAQVPAPHDAWVHYGITTYDVMDTGTVLQVRDGLDALRADIDLLCEQWETLATGHRDTVMIGRTNGQHAQPTTFGLRVAGWLEELLRHRERLDGAARRVLHIQLGSMVGTLASVHPHGLRLREEMAVELGLAVPLSNWHNNRDALAALLQSLGLLCASLARIARDVASLCSSDFGELREAGARGRGRSSGMPHKRNPRAAEFAEALGHLGRQRAEAASDVMGQEHERSGGRWIAEWMIVPEVFLLGSGALRWSLDLFARLEVDAVRMRENIDASRGLAMSECLTLTLAARVDKFRARALMDEACAAARAGARPLQQVMREMPEVMALISEEELADCFRPEAYLGHAGEMVDAVVAASVSARRGASGSG
jgi:3-carboxy-cis,cis-muconate cycloisomerase